MLLAGLGWKRSSPSVFHHVPSTKPSLVLPRDTLPSTLPVLVIPVLDGHVAAPQQSLPVQGVWGGSPGSLPHPLCTLLQLKELDLCAARGAKTTVTPSTPHSPIPREARPPLAPRGGKLGRLFVWGIVSAPRGPRGSPLSAFPPPC